MNSYKIFDAHCDTLCCLCDSGGTIAENTYNIDKKRMLEYVKYTQVFACFIAPRFYDDPKARFDALYKTYLAQDFAGITPVLSLEGGEVIDSLEDLEYLKECGVYDNTRIIIVSDHGRTLGQFDDLLVSEELDVQGYHPILLVKDFNAGEFRISQEFMTNGDVPLLALEGLVENPVNPFPGNSIDDTAKKEGRLYITTAENYDQNPENTIDMTGGVWYTITGENIFDKNNWKKVEEPVVE